jgi:catechol 2,3-dioxygenase-like lactoylglutathione lyase family enzyme
MQQKLALIAIVVDDYDKAISFYTGKMNFRLVEDTALTDTKRWVVVGPKGDGGCNLLLAKAASEEQAGRVGNQTGGRVFLFLHTDNLDRDYQYYSGNGISFVRPPSEEPFGKVAVFKDLYGNLWDLVEPKQKKPIPQ